MDDYESRYLASSEVILFDKQRSYASLLVFVTLGALLAAIAIGAASQGTVDGAVAATLPSLLAAACFIGSITSSVLRIQLTARELKVHWGLTRYDVRLSDISECQVLPFERARLAQLEGARLMMPMTGKSDLVRVAYLDRKGRPASIAFSASNPNELVEAIREHAPKEQKLRLEAEAELARLLEQDSMVQRATLDGPGETSVFDHRPQPRQGPHPSVPPPEAASPARSHKLHSQR